MNQNFPPSSFLIHPCFSAPLGQLLRYTAQGDALKSVEINQGRYADSRFTAASR